MQKLVFAFNSVVLGLVLASAQPATAKNPATEQLLSSRVGTISTDAEPIFKSGLLTGCGLNFATLVRDFTYKAGTYSRVDGSFNLMTAKNNLGILLKIVVNDIDPTTYEFVPSKPATAFFVAGTTTSLPFLVKESLDTDTPGAIVAVYNAHKTLPMLVQSVSTGLLTVAFAREVGGTDMQVPVDLSVEDTDDNGNKKRSKKAAQTFLECASDLVKSLEAR